MSREPSGGRHRPSTRVRAVLLDIDGTLLDSNDAHARSWVDALAQHGVTVAFDVVRPTIGMGGDKVLPMLAGIASDGERGKAISDTRLSVFTNRYLPDLKPTRGARVLVERILETGLRPVVATSAGAELADLLRMAGVGDLLPLRTTSDDASRSKPDPDIVDAALKKAGVGPAAAVMVGDTPYDIQAAGKAGVESISLRCGGWWRDADLAGAAGIYDDPADLLDSWASSAMARADAEP